MYDSLEHGRVIVIPLLMALNTILGCKSSSLVGWGATIGKLGRIYHSSLRMQMPFIVRLGFAKRCLFADDCLPTEVAGLDALVEEGEGVS